MEDKVLDLVNFYVLLMEATFSKKPFFLFIPKLIASFGKVLVAMRFFIGRKKLSVGDIEKIRSVTEKSIGKNKDLVPDKIENAVISLIKLING